MTSSDQRSVLCRISRQAIPSLFGIVICALLATPTALGQTAADNQPPERTRYWARDFSLHDVDSQTAIARLESLGIEIPFQLEGKISLDATVWIPFGNLLDATKYRFDATLTSPRLTINSVRLADATTQFQVDEGMLHLRDLQGTLLDAVSLQAAGKLTGTGSARLVPLGALELTLRLQDLNLQTASRDIADLKTELQGLASGNVTFSHPDITKTENLLQWTADGAVEVESFAINSDRFWDLSIEALRVRNGIVRAEGLLAEQRIAGEAEVIGAMQGTANVQLFPAGPVSLDVNFGQIDLRHATESLSLEVPLAGVASGSVHFENPSLDRLNDEAAWRGNAQLTVDRFRYENFPGAEQRLQLQFGKLTLRDGGTRLEDFTATLVGAATNQLMAAARGSASVELFPAGALQVDLAFDSVALEAFADEVLPDRKLTGVAAGRVRATHPQFDLTDPDNLQRWNVQGGIEIDGFAVDSDRLWDLTVESLHVQNGALRAEGFRAEQRIVGEAEVIGVLQGTANVQLLPAGNVSLNANLRQIDLSHAVESLKLDVPLTGIADGTARIENPSLELLDEETAWSGEAALRVDQFRYANFPGADQQLQLRFGKLTLEDGGVTLEDFSADQYVTTTNQLMAAVRGSASARLFPVGPVQVDLAFNNVALTAFSQAPFADVELAGTAAGTLQATNPRVDGLTTFADWTGVGQLAVDQLVVGSRPPIDVEIPQYAMDPDGVAVSQSTIRGEGWNGTAEGHYVWNDPHPFRVQIATPGIPTGELYRWVSGQPAPDETAGTVAFGLEATGQQDPDTWAVSGEVRVPSAQLAGIRIVELQHRLTANSQKFTLVPLTAQRAAASTPDHRSRKDTLRLGRIETQYKLSEDSFRVDQFIAEVFGGVVEGNALIALDSADPEEPAEHQAQLRWQGLDYAGTVSISDSDFQVQSMSSGDVQWSVASSRFDDPRAHQFQANIQLPSLSLSQQRLGDLTLQATSEGDHWKATINGTLLDGRAESEITADIASASQWRQLVEAEVQGTLAVTSVDIGRLFAFWQTTENVQQWRGQADLHWTFRGLTFGSGNPSIDGPSSGSVAGTDSVASEDAVETLPARGDVSSFRADGMIRVVDIAHAGRRVTDRLELQVGFDGNAVVVKQFTGSFAGGRLGASGSWRRSGASTGLSLLLTGVDTSRALLVLSPALAERISGIASGRIVLAGQTELRASGRLDVRDMRLDPFRFGTLRSSVDGTFDLGSQQWRVRFRDVAGSIAQGRIRGQASLSSSPGQADRFGLDSRWELDNVDFEKAIGTLSTGRAAPGKGKLSGQLTIKGRRIASVADLEGALDARLDGTEANAVPGLPSARNQLGALSLRGTTFDSGEIHGRFRRGTFNVTELWLDSDQLRVWADGNVSLASRRWDIDAVIATGNFEQANVTLLTLARQVSLDATLPVGVIVRINEALSDRVVFLRLTGPMSRPQVRIQARQTLGQNAARFFLRSLTDSLAPLPSPGPRR